MPVRGYFLFAMQTAISSVGMSFGIAMLARGGDPGYYLPIVSAIIGFWLPQPTLRTAIQASAAGDVARRRNHDASAAESTASQETVGSAADMV